MIAQLRGVLRGSSGEEVVLDVGGVGYQVFVSAQTLASLPAEGTEVELFTVTHVREEALQLFGFADRGERALFVLLQSVSGIGPRLALNILSGIAAADLRGAIVAGNVARLKQLQGVGAKTAERIVLELKDKVGAVAEPRRPAADGSRDRLASDAASALINLGVRPPEAARAVEVALASGKLSLPEIVTEALKGVRR